MRAVSSFPCFRGIATMNGPCIRLFFAYTHSSSERRVLSSRRLSAAVRAVREGSAGIGLRLATCPTPSVSKTNINFKRGELSKRKPASFLLESVQYVERQTHEIMFFDSGRGSDRTWFAWLHGWRRQQPGYSTGGGSTS